MTEDRDFKQAVRQRAARTGESYQAAWRNMVAQDGPPSPAEGDVVLPAVLDDANRNELRALLVAALTSTERSTVTIDGSRVTEVTPDGIGVLVGALKRAGAASRSLVLRRASPVLSGALARLDLGAHFGLDTSRVGVADALVPRAVGRRLAERRHVLGMTLQDVARTAHLSRLKVDLIERGAAAVTADGVAGLRRALRLPADLGQLLEEAAGLASATHVEEAGDQSRFPVLARAPGCWLSWAGNDVRTWLDLFVVDANALYFPAVAVSWDDEPDQQLFAPGTHVGIEVPSGGRCAGKVRELSATEHDRAADLVGARFNSERDWFAMSHPCSRSTSKTPMADGARPNRRPVPDADAIANAFALGQPRQSPTEVDGGGVHRLWKLVTSRGVYAVKDLRNPPGGDQWIDDYLKAWPLERACHEHGGVAMAAPLLTTDGAVLAVVPDNADGERVVRIHTWADGQNPPWTASHARLAAAIGATLARIHAVGSTIVRDEGQATSASAVPATDRWYRAIDDARDEPWAVELRATLPSILLAEELVAAAASDPGPVVMCHRDINPKNVLVGQGEPVVLDWDAAGPHPARAELACAALTWAGIEAGDPQPDALQSVVRGYRATADLAGGLTPPDIAGWAMPWLRFSEFNVARLLGQRGDLDAKEQAVARQRLDHGIRQLRRFAHHADEWGALVSGLAS